MNNEFRMVSDIVNSLKEFKLLIRTGVLNEPQSPFFKPSLVQILILARDLTYKSHKIGKTIDFVDDVKITEKVKNVTFLIKHARDAVCHIDSNNHVLSMDENIVFSYNVQYGKGVLAVINGIELSSDYEDDICIFFGEHKVYLSRHIIRAIVKAEENFKEHYKDTEYAFFLDTI